MFLRRLHVRSIFPSASHNPRSQVGPPLGAYFASHPFSPTFANIDFNIYAAPAALTLVLLLLETAFLGTFLPETKGKGALPDLDDLDVSSEKATSGNVAADPKERLRVLGVLKLYHFFFLALFSGMFLYLPP